MVDGFPLFPVPIPSRWSRPIAGHIMGYLPLLDLRRRCARFCVNYTSGSPAQPHTCPALRGKQKRERGLLRCVALPCLASPELPPRRLDLPLRQRPPPIFVGIWRTGINNSGRLSTQSLAHHTTTMLAQRSLRHPGTPSSWQPAAPCASGADCRVPARPPPRRSAPESRRVEGAAIAVAGAGGPKGAAAGAAQASIMASRRLTRPVDRPTDTGNCSVANARRRGPRKGKGKGEAGHVDPNHCSWVASFRPRGLRLWKDARFLFPFTHPAGRAHE